VKAELLSIVPNPVLAVYAHPDDADVACGGTLKKWIDEGSDVHVVICTKGEKGTKDPDADIKEVAAKRRSEVEEAAAILGFSALHFLNIDDGEIVNDETLRADIVEIVRSVKPEVVLAPDPTAVFFSDHYFNHRDHREIGWAVLDAVYPACGLPKYYPDRGKAHVVSAVMLSGTLAPDVFVDITGTVEKKVTAVLSHKSQISGDEESVRDAIEHMAKDAGGKCGKAFAEGFRMVGSLGVF
jgi:LmbE family N-acetylglucosaminyl deacetylase